VRAIATEPIPSDDGKRESLPSIVARLTDDEPLDRRARAGLVGRLAVLLGQRGRRLADAVTDIAPHIRIRDRRTLHAHFANLDDDSIAAHLVASAARATATIGAAGGVLSSIEMAAPPVLLTAPVQIAAETVAVVAIEMKLIAELHELFDRGVAGTPAVRGAAYLGAWARRRGLDPFAPGPSLTGTVTGAAQRELRQRLIRRAGRNATTVVPFLAGAIAGASLNRRETLKLGDRILRDLRPPRR
jgi:hypothetical protein